MFSHPRWAEVCRNEVAHAFTPSEFCDAAAPPRDNPIDRYYAATRALLKIAGATIGPAAATSLAAVKHDAGRLLVLGLLSETERYFRDLLAALVAFCPVCAAHVGEETVKIATVLQRGDRSVGIGLFDEVSFSSSKAVFEQSKRVGGMSIGKKSPLAKCIGDYGKLCHVRHAAVHSGGQMADHNVIALGLDPGVETCVAVDFGGFSSATTICHNLVRAYNRSLYKHIVEKWMTERHLHGTWAQDKYLFKQLYALFYSASDGVGPTQAHHAYHSLRATIAKVTAST